MSAKRVLATLLALAMMLPAGMAQSQAQPQAPAPPGNEEQQGQDVQTTPARISYINGQVSFWRPGAEDWAPAAINTPLAPGDLLYTGPDGNVEVQIGARAFVRAASGTQLGLDNQEPDFVQFKVTAGHAAVDLRELSPGQTIELDTPNAALTIEHTGYYRVSVAEDRSAFIARRGGRASLTPASGAAVGLESQQQLLVTGTDAPRVQATAAPELAAWDRWNYERTGQLVSSPSAKYVPRGVYGTQELDRHGSWRTVETYGTVWVPRAVAVGWAPYSTGRWIWDPFYGWTWLDDAPWGWAPYHYGRWVHVSGFWAWTPGPIVVRPVYAPALVVFFGGPVIHRPVAWVALGWGEPSIPWWGRPGFVGRPWWGGWGGPRVVNNVVINRTSVVNVTNITVYRHTSVRNAVVGVSAERFGRDHVSQARVASVDVRQLEPVRGRLSVKPAAASLMPASGAAVKPPEQVVKRSVVATRAPRDVSAPLRAEGLAHRSVPAASGPSPSASSATLSAQPPAPKIVPAPPRGRAAARGEDGRGPAARDEGSRPDKARREGQDAKQPPEATQPRDGKSTATEPPRSDRQPGVTTAPRTAPPAETRQPEVKPGRSTPPPLPRGERAGPRREERSGEPRVERGKPAPPAPAPPAPAKAPPDLRQGRPVSPPAQAPPPPRGAPQQSAPQPDRGNDRSKREEPRVERGRPAPPAPAPPAPAQAPPDPRQGRPVPPPAQAPPPPRGAPQQSAPQPDRGNDRGKREEPGVERGRPAPPAQAPQPSQGSPQSDRDNGRGKRQESRAEAR
ncbi:MAG: hypothetical protein HYV93_01200 [Candidatus Rokubacteria bacterium]|nr:hypothetical protein [Candidatus Rokubacteria bacterium]